MFKKLIARVMVWVDWLLDKYGWLLSRLLWFKFNNVNRERYLRHLVKRYRPDDDGTLLSLAIEKSPTVVFSEKELGKEYRRLMWRCGVTVFVVSFALTLVPDELWITILSVCLDLAIFQCVLYIAMQKVMMLYGQECDLHNDRDEGVKKIIAIESSGLMIGKYPLLQKMKTVVGWLGKQAVKRIGPKLLSKMSQSVFVVLRRQAIKWGSVVLAKQHLDMALALLVPITCGVISGIVSVVIFIPMCNKLRKHLRQTKEQEMEVCCG